MKKKCGICKERKSLHLFSGQTLSHDGYSYYCKRCVKMKRAGNEFVGMEALCEAFKKYFSETTYKDGKKI